MIASKPGARAALPRGWKEPQGGAEVPADPSDASAWYPDFPQCPTDQPAMLDLAGPDGTKPQCTQHPLPHASARFTRTVAPPIRPVVNVTKPAYLFMLGTPYSGTTALLGLLTSSPKVTIPSRGWAHEGQWMLVCNHSSCSDGLSRFHSLPAFWFAIPKSLYACGHAFSVLCSALPVAAAARVIVTAFLYPIFHSLLCRRP